MKTARRPALLALAALLLIFAARCTRMLDNRYVYFPDPWQEGDWAAASRLPLEDVWFESKDGVKLHGWYVKAEEPDAPVLLFAHGNAGNVIHRLDQIALMRTLGLAVFIFDYRGYGRSEGQPSEPGLYQDAEAAYDALTQRLGIPPKRIVIYGQSLGSAVAGKLAGTRPVAGLVLEAPFPSIQAVANVYYGLLPVQGLLEARFRLVEHLKTVRTPVLVIHGERDSIIPISLGRQVHTAANEPKTLLVLPHADHNDVFVAGGQAYRDGLGEFVRKVTAGP